MRSSKEPAYRTLTGPEFDAPEGVAARGPSIEATSAVATRARPAHVTPVVWTRLRSFSLVSRAGVSQDMAFPFSWSFSDFRGKVAHPRLKTSKNVAHAESPFRCPEVTRVAPESEPVAPV